LEFYQHCITLFYIPPQKKAMTAIVNDRKTTPVTEPIKAKVEWIASYAQTLAVLGFLVILIVLFNFPNDKPLILIVAGLVIVSEAVLFLPVLSGGLLQRSSPTRTRIEYTKAEEKSSEQPGQETDILETLGAVIDTYDIYTYGHSTQVAIYARAIAQKMNFSKREQELIVKAALVHDIGKIGINDTIISKPARLTEDELIILRRHPVLGATILMRMRGFQEIIPLVRYHHERWDGRGYPENLRGEAIPLGARILALADSLDAMCSDRPYRPTLSFDQVVDRIQRGCGTQFDPKVVKAFFDLLEDNGVEFFINSANVVDHRVFPENNLNPNTVPIRFLKRGLITTSKN
jgi:putative nucleotidyltransferase with HDIG domain